MKNKFLKDFLVKVNNFSEVSIKTGDTEINPYKKAIQEYIFHWDRADDTTKKEFTRIGSPLKIYFSYLFFPFCNVYWYSLYINPIFNISHIMTFFIV